MPTIDLTDAEHAAVTAAIRRAIAGIPGEFLLWGSACDSSCLLVSFLASVKQGSAPFFRRARHRLNQTDVQRRPAPADGRFEPGRYLRA